MAIPLEYHGFGMTRAELERQQLAASRAHLALVSLLKEHGCPIADGDDIRGTVDRWLDGLKAGITVVGTFVPAEPVVPLSVLRRIVAAGAEQVACLQKDAAQKDRAYLAEQRMRHLLLDAFTRLRTVADPVVRALVEDALKENT